jgi:hypothetical protein
MTSAHLCAFSVQLGVPFLKETPRAWRTIKAIKVRAIRAIRGIFFEERGMEYRRLGRTGLKVSAICLGTMQFGWSADEPTAHAVMSRAVELGCNFLDTADIYSRWVPNNPGGVSERMIGAWLKASSVRREDVIIATKARGRMGDGPNDEGLSRKRIFDAVEASLRRLQTDYIDLYQLHWPDEETPLEETLQALDDLVRAGKVRYLGCSNFPAWLLMKALVGERQTRLGALRQLAAPLQPGAPRRVRARIAAAVPGPGRRRDSLQPAGRRLFDGQISPRRAPAGFGAGRERAQPLHERMGFYGR